MFDEMIKTVLAQLTQTSMAAKQQPGQETTTAFKPLELVNRSEHQALQQKYIAHLENTNALLQDNLAIQRNYLLAMITQNNSIDGLQRMVTDKNQIIDKLTADLEQARLQADTARKGT
jgi:DNA-binding helix-hairpin-helix protein with protein kinase domain